MLLEDDLFDFVIDDGYWLLYDLCVVEKDVE